MPKSGPWILAAIVLVACGPPSRDDRGSGSRDQDSFDAGNTPHDAGASGCTRDAQCPPGTVCDLLDGVCVERNEQDGGSPTDAGNPSTTCSTKYDCTSGRICRNGACAVPDPTCHSDLDCPGGQLCNFSKVCEPGCTDPRDCASPLLCHPQRFACETCALSNPCPAGKACLNGTCQASATCANTQSCVSSGQDGTVCVNGRCTACATHADCAVEPYRTEERLCGSDGLCRAISCSDSSCRNSHGPRGYCDTSTNQCKLRECISDNDCPSGEVCDGASLTCVEGGCGGTALQQCTSQCEANGTTCNTATCACNAAPGDGSECTSSAECETNYVCSLAICSEAAVDATTGAPCDLTMCFFGTCVGAATGRVCDAFGCVMAAQMGGEPACL